MDILFATTNMGKIKEIQNLFQDSSFCVKTMKDIGINIEVKEDGITFEENSIKKATEIMKISNMLTLSDDSGLEIDALEKRPGVHSARFLTDAPYIEKNQKILESLNQVPSERRTARFVCVITAAFPDGRIFTVKDTLEGRIAFEAKGTNGFGYDPIFYVPELDMNLAEATQEQKNVISHRGKALRQMKEILATLC